MTAVHEACGPRPQAAGAPSVSSAASFGDGRRNAPSPTAMTPALNAGARSSRAGRGRSPSRVRGDGGVVEVERRWKKRERRNRSRRFTLPLNHAADRQQPPPLEGLHRPRHAVTEPPPISSTLSRPSRSMSRTCRWSSDNRSRGPRPRYDTLDRRPTTVRSASSGASRHADQVSREAEAAFVADGALVAHRPNAGGR